LLLQRDISRQPKTVQKESGNASRKPDFSSSDPLAVSNGEDFVGFSAPAECNSGIHQFVPGIKCFADVFCQYTLHIDGF